MLTKLYKSSDQVSCFVVAANLNNCQNHKSKMSRKGRYRKFGPDFEPEPWYTDNEDNEIENERFRVTVPLVVGEVPDGQDEVMEHVHGDPNSTGG